MNLFGYELRVERSFMRQGVNLWLVKHHHDGTMSYLKQWEEGNIVVDRGIEQRDEIDVPFISDEMAQRLLEELWALGFRPRSEGGSIGAFNASQEHLKDLQTLKDRLLTMIEKGWDKTL